MFKRFLISTFSLALLASPLAFASQANALQAGGLPTATTVQDGTTSEHADIAEVNFYSATSQEPASVVVNFDEAPTGGEAIKVWLNLDGDSQPDMLVSGVAYSEFTVWKTKGWGKLGKPLVNRSCASMSLGDGYASVEFNPNCFGKSKRMQVNVSTDVRVGSKHLYDFAPSQRTWSKKIRSWS